MSASLTVQPFSGPLRDHLAAAEADPVAIYWLGQAGFVISGAGRRIAIDPYLSDSLARKYRGKRFSHERMMPAPVEADQLPPLDLVLCTHQHTDHMDAETLRPIATKDPGVGFVVPEASLDEARRRIDVGDERLVPLDAGCTVEPVTGIRVSAIRAAHESLETDADGHHRYLGYVVAIGGVTILHPGDTVPYDGQVAEIAAHAPDIALLPVNGRSAAMGAAGIAGNLTLDEALDLCDACGIPVMIAHHYGMFAFNTVSPESIDEHKPANVRLERAQVGTEYRVDST